jgi:hypothetical protein
MNNISIKKQYSNNYISWYLNINPKPNKKFIDWISIIEKFIQEKIKLTLLDLPDEDYMIYFESNYTPTDMIKIILDSNDLNF